MNINPIISAVANIKTQQYSRQVYWTHISTSFHSIEQANFVWNTVLRQSLIVHLNLSRGLQWKGSELVYEAILFDEGTFCLQIACRRVPCSVQITLESPRLASNSLGDKAPATPRDPSIIFFKLVLYFERHFQPWMDWSSLRVSYNFEPKKWKRLWNQFPLRRPSRSIYLLDVMFTDFVSLHK